MPTNVRHIDFLERASRYLTLFIMSLAALALLMAPPLAIGWQNRLFPGFMFEQTLVAADFKAPGWSGRSAGIDYPQRLTRIAGVPVDNAGEVEAVLAAHELGDRIAVFTRLPDGTAQLYPNVILSQFTAADLLRLFWTPYLVGVVYFLIGMWVYRMRGSTRPGRALAFFCFSVAITCILFFDLFSTHAGVPLWLLAVSMIGGALISLALRFPAESRAVVHRPWLLAVPYGISLALSLWAIVALGAPSPWAYASSRYSIYRYIAVGVLIFLGMMVWQASAGVLPTLRRQARIVLLGGALAFAPFAAWSVAPLLGIHFTFDAVIVLPSLILFPLAVAISIFRYRLLEIDFIVNRTIFYGVVTAILAGVISVTMGSVQRFFLALTGEKSDLAAVITTLVVVSMFEPIKARVRGLVERTFKGSPDVSTELRAFGEDVRSHVMLNDPASLTQHLLQKAAAGLQAGSGALSLYRDGRLQTVYTFGDWRGESWMMVPVASEGTRVGMLALGPRLNNESYEQHECDLLQSIAAEVASAVRQSGVEGV